MKTYAVRQEREENNNRLNRVDNKGNVLSLIPQGNTGGIERLCLDMARLSAEGFYYYFMWGGGIYADKIKEYTDNIEIRHFSYRKMFNEYIYLKKYIVNNKIDILLIQVPSPIFLIFSQLLKKSRKNLKICIYIHADPNGIFTTRLKQFQYKLFQRYSDGCIAISDFVANEMRNQYNCGNISVIPNGIDLKNFSFVKKNSPTEPVNFTFVGRLVTEKGLDILFHALAGIDNKYHLSIIGTGPCEEYLKELSASLGMAGSISFLGERDNVENLLQKMDYLVHPATCNEGFGISLVEAMASGVPCIAFAKGAIPELIEDNKDGMLVRNYSVEGYRDKLLEAINLYNNGFDQYLEMRENARTKAEMYDIHEYIENLKSYLYSL